MKKGTYVLRSTYQKLAEENKKLLNDIRILSEEGFSTVERIRTLAKWRKKFKADKEFVKTLKQFSKHFVNIYNDVYNPNKACNYAERRVSTKKTK